LPSAISATTEERFYLMSADNGVYILETEGPEYRVREMMAVENINWNDETGNYTGDDKIIIVNARRMWHDCKVYTDFAEVLMKAAQILKATDICEYGISFIRVNQKF
jgi:hypothetical protein